MTTETRRTHDEGEAELFEFLVDSDGGGGDIGVEVGVTITSLREAIELEAMAADATCICVALFSVQLVVLQVVLGKDWLDQIHSFLTGGSFKLLWIATWHIASL